MQVASDRNPDFRVGEDTFGLGVGEDESEIEFLILLRPGMDLKQACVVVLDEEGLTGHHTEYRGMVLAVLDIELSGLEGRGVVGIGGNAR